MRIWPALCAAGLLFGFAAAVRAQPIGSMKLLAPNVGWALSTGRLMWTSSAGAKWENITPPAAKDDLISAIFFLDTSRGWVLLKRGKPDIPGRLQFDLASTGNAGATWSVAPLRMPDWLSGSLFGGGASLAFADPSHGWLALYAGPNDVSRGQGSILATSDGGISWMPTHPPNHGRAEAGLAGPIVMVTPQFGWMVSGAANEVLLVTRDRAKTWNTVELESPVKTSQMREYDRNLDLFEQRSHQAPPLGVANLERKQPLHPSYAAYDLPTFEDSSHGYICVTYPGVTVLFVTEDGGVTWKPDRVVEGRPLGPSAMVGATWITGRVSKNGVPKLANIARAATIAPSTLPGPEDRPAYGISFATEIQGWVLTNDSKLLATNDGGATWTDITPSIGPRVATP
jgi:hypothetical protein